MATYNNHHWLLSHIRNSFIATDDTGMCEAVMLSEDLPSQYAQHYNIKTQTFRTDRQNTVTPNTRPPEDLLCYPGLIEQDDEEDALTQSYDIQMDQEIGLHRHRSNTAQKLEKMDIARKKASKIKNIKCDDSTAVMNSESMANLFIRNDNYQTRGRLTSLLSEQLIKCPKQPQNKFLEYAKFDGTAQTGISTRTIKIFLTMLPEKKRNYPLQICVTSTAKISDFIGLICYKCSIAYPNVPLQSIKHYDLYITEEDGEVDMDLPALDTREPCSKFGFSHLALAVRRFDSITTSTSSHDQTLSITSQSEINKIMAENKAQSDQQDEDLARMKLHTAMMEAPLYVQYRVYILNKARFKTEIQLGISGEKIEIDPVQQKNSRFWTRQKSVNHLMETIVWSEITEIKSNRSLFRIVYSPIKAGQNQQQQFSRLYSSQPQSFYDTTNISGVLISSTVPTSSSTSSSSSQYKIGKSNYSSNIYTATPESPQQTASSSSSSSITSFKHYDFETDSKTANEIVKKVNNILEVRTSDSRREYLESREKKKLLNKKFHLSTSK